MVTLLSRLRILQGFFGHVMKNVVLGKEGACLPSRSAWTFHGIRSLAGEYTLAET